MDISKLQKEYENAGRGWFRAAFGSIIRRNYGEIKRMNTVQRKQLIRTIGAPDTYITELSKELKGVEYERHREQDKNNHTNRLLHQFLALLISFFVSIR